VGSTVPVADVRGDFRSVNRGVLALNHGTKAAKVAGAVSRTVNRLA
jgi:hypothetical protein